MARGIGEDLTNKQINNWTILEELGSGIVLAQCKCGTIREVRKASIKNGHAKSCGCLFNKQKKEVVGQKINHWTVLQDLGGGKIICKCDCEAGTVRELYKKAVLQGKSKSCGCASGRQTRNIIGKKINHWTVLEELTDGKVKCQCDCENKTIRILYKKAVYEERSKSCGCAKVESMEQTKKDNGYYEKLNEETTLKYKKMDFGEWTVIKAIPGTSKVLCKCSCGNIAEVYKSHLVNGESRSCGCKKVEHAKDTMKSRYNEISIMHVDNPREQWQIDAISSKENLEKFISKLKSTDSNIFIKDLSEKLGISNTHMLRKIHEYKLEDKITMPKDSMSRIESLIYKYIKSRVSCEIIRNNRSIISPYELDIYIPSLKLGIEVNGDYWHSTLHKDKDYHKVKMLMALNKGIRLINIYEYEMNNSPLKVKGILDNALSINKNTVYARQCNIIELDGKSSREFEEKYHLDGSAVSSIRIALEFNNEIVGEMTFGKPRFDNKYSHELIRLCFKDGINITGGTEKMFKYAIEKYKLSTIVTYCNLDKFSGKVYNRLGFKIIDVTEPGYLWVKHETHEVLRRYQTQKHILLEKGLGTPDQTEDEIMINLDFFKIYNSGNAKYVYNVEGV